MYNEIFQSNFDDIYVERNLDPLSVRSGIIKQIVDERKRQKITQKELADRTGLKQSNISRLETGKSNPSLDFLSKIAAGLGRELQVNLK